MHAEVLSANALAARGPAGAGLVIRDLSNCNAAAREEVARLAAEAALRDKENARLRAMLAQQAEALARLSGAAQLSASTAPPPRKAAFAPTTNRE